MNHTFTLNNRLRQLSYFPIPVRGSAQERVKRHTFYFATITSAFALGYHFMTLNLKFSMTQAAKCFVHKTVIGLAYFYSNQIIWAWLAKTREESTEQFKTKRISNWSVNSMTAFLIFPLLIGINLLYKLPARKTIFKSITDSLLLTAFSLQFDRNLRYSRNILLQGTPEQKQKLMHRDFLFLTKNNK